MVQYIITACDCCYSIIYLGAQATKYYLGFFRNYVGGQISILLVNYESHPAPYIIEAPGVKLYYGDSIPGRDGGIARFSSSLLTLSHSDQDKGIYIEISSDKVAVIGQNEYAGTSDTFLLLPILNTGAAEYTYFAISVARSMTVWGSRYHSSILIVGTRNNTVMKLTVTQEVIVSVGNTTTLVPGKQYLFLINRFQTMLLKSLNDLTSSEIITNKPVSVFSGHECGNVPLHSGDCDHMVEQIPPTTEWGRVLFIVPLATRRSYTIKVLAEQNFTVVDVYCNNSETSYTLDKGDFFTKNLSQDFCAIKSNNRILVAQFSHVSSDDGVTGDSMMTLIPAKLHYSDKLYSATIQNPSQQGYVHYVNIIVLAQYYQPDKIYLISGGVNISLDTQEWVPFVVNKSIEAYATQVKVSIGGVVIIHSNKEADMAANVYGFASIEGYGHSARKINSMKGKLHN